MGRVFESHRDNQILELMNHYTYEIIGYKGMRYIGVRSCKVQPEDDTSYMGSCATLKKDIQRFGIESFQKTVLATHKTRSLAVAHEIELHEKYDVARNTEFYNAVRQTSTGFDSFGQRLKGHQRGEKNSQYGKPRSEETKRKISEALKGKRRKSRKYKPLSKEHKEALSKALKGRQPSEETKRKMRAGRKNLPHTEETKRKMSKAHTGKRFPDGYTKKS